MGGMNSLAQPLATLTVTGADAAFVALTAAFFALAIAFARFCEKVR